MNYFYGVCEKCGCGTSVLSERYNQSREEHCFGCGRTISVKYDIDENGMFIFKKNIPSVTMKEVVGFGSCLTKDNRLIAFKEVPSYQRILELEQDAISLVLWNEKEKWLDIIVGSPLMKKDVVFLEKNNTINKYVNEPKIGEYDDDGGFVCRNHKFYNEDGVEEECFPF